MSNIRQAVRHLARLPGLSLIVVAILAVGIGATTGMYSIYRTVLVDPLPVTDPQSLVNITSPGPRRGTTSTFFAGRSESVFSYPMFRDLEAQQRSLAGIAGHRAFEANIGIDGQTAAGIGMLVSGQYFDVLGLTPALGRLIQAEDEPHVDAAPVAVLSYDYWQQSFAGSPAVLGRTLVVNGRILTIIGVAPPAFSGTTMTLSAQVFVPLSLRWLMMPTAMPDADNRQSFWVYAFGRLPEAVTRNQAQNELTGLYSGILRDAELPLLDDRGADAIERFVNQPIELTPGARGQSNAAEFASESLNLLIGVAVLVLIVVCVNIASLLLAASEGRIAETAIRASIGATRARLIGQFLLESFLLAFAGAIAGIPVANATLRIVASLLPQCRA